MKKNIFILLLFASFTAFSQNCEGFYYLQKDKVVEMTISNKKGKDVGKNTYTITNVTTSGGTISSTINSEFVDSKGKVISKATNNMKCTGGVLMMDIKAFIPSPQQEQMGTVAGGGEVYIEYPASMKEGDALKDASFAMDFKSAAGIGGHIALEMTNRKVAGKENVTTAAGTWDCYKITYHSKMVFKIGIGIPMNSDVTEWYAPGFGVVKTESKSGTTEITAIK